MPRTTHKWLWSWLAPALVLGLTLPALAQPGDSVPEESLIRWQYFQEIELPPSGDARWYDVVIPNSVFSSARIDLADLRVYDAAEREVPYALRVLQKQSRDVTAETKEFNKVVVDGNVRELSLVVLKEGIEYNEVIVNTSGDSFRRKVLLEGSDDKQQWRKIIEDQLLRFGSGSNVWDQKKLEFRPPVRFTYLRLRVFPDPEVDREPVEIVSVEVQHRVEFPGEYVTQSAELGPREAVRTSYGEGSAWFANFGANEIPFEKIEVDVADTDFVRNFEIQRAGPEGSRDSPVHVTTGLWRRRAGQEPKPLVAEFKEQRASRIRIEVTDHRNEPLTIQEVRYVAPVRQLVIPADAEFQRPLRLYFGNPKAEAPNYDFAGNLPPRLDPKPVRAAFGPLQTNPNYTPEPLPLSERLPWLIYVVLGAVILVLAALILSMARAAITAHDQQQATAA